MVSLTDKELYDIAVNINKNLIGPFWYKNMPAIGILSFITETNPYRHNEFSIAIINDTIFVDEVNTLYLLGKDHYPYSIERVRPMTDAEIDSFKHAPYSEDWETNIPLAGILCWVTMYSGARDWLIKNSKIDVIRSIYEKPNQAKQYMGTLHGYNTAIPVTNEELDAFKIGFTL